MLLALRRERLGARRRWCLARVVAKPAARSRILLGPLLLSPLLLGPLLLGPLLIGPLLIRCWRGLDLGSRRRRR